MRQRPWPNYLLLTCFSEESSLEPTASPDSSLLVKSVKSSCSFQLVIMVKTVELKPPQEIIDAIQASEDGSTAPLEAEVLQGTGATREIANKLVHEEPQKPSDLPDELRHGDDHGADPVGPMSSEEKKMKFEEMQDQQKAMQYDRQHPGAGRAGKGDQQIDSAQGISRDARGQKGSRQT